MVKKVNQKKRIPDVPVDVGGAAMAILMAMSEGFSDLGEIVDFPLNAKKTKSKIKKNVDVFDWHSEIQEFKKESLRTTAWRLRKKGLIEKTGESYQLSVFGMEVVRKVQIEERKEWDGKWRMVIFDIPEAKRNERDWMRKELVGMEYRPIQRSVFLGQYPLSEDFIEELKDRDLESCVRFLTVGDINKKELENIFNW